jgi:signal transduction histidine kinase
MGPLWPAGSTRRHALVSTTTRDLTQALYMAAVALGRTRDAEEVVRAAIAETQRASGVEAVSLYLLDASRNTLILREYAGTTPTFREQMAVLPLSEAQIAATAIRERRAVVCEISQYPTPAIRELYQNQGFRHLTSVPVAGREEILGVLQLASRREPLLTAEGVALVQAIGGLVGVALENAALRERMTAQQDRLRVLAGGILHAREEEARRIAHELHDETGQLLASVHIALDNLVQKVPERAGIIRELHGLLDRVEGQLRRLSQELRPTILDDLGLAPALEWLARGVAQRTGLAIVVDARVERLPSVIETAVYRIIQEALTNASRHARAKSVRVELRAEGPTILATVRDDGEGFDVEAALARRGDRGLGLIGIWERADALGGKIVIRSAPGKGAELSVTIPLERTV